MAGRRAKDIHIKKLSESLSGADRPRSIQALQNLYRTLETAKRTAGELETMLLTFRRHITGNQRLAPDIGAVEPLVRSVLADCSDIVFRNFKIGNTRQALLVFVEGLIDNKLLNENIVKPLLYYRQQIPLSDERTEETIGNFLEQQVISSAQVVQVGTLQEILTGILSGDAALLIDGSEAALVISIKKWEKRSVSEPTVEPAIRGPQEAFIETLRTNTSMIRRRLKTPRLKMKMLQVGRLSQTNVVITYLEGITNPALLAEVEKRINSIDVDAILESGNIEELIEDNPFSIFPQLSYTERPDKLVSCLLEGQVGIMVDNTPFALIAPQSFFQMIQAPDDYYERFIGSSLIRLVRYAFLFVALLLPALYIAVSTFHQGMIPTTLLFSMAASRENIPFPAFVEAMIMEIFFEGLREAGVRLPRPVGQTVSIVGALVIGQAAIQAGIVSAPMVITVSITGIASFTVPRFNQAIAIRVLRFVLMILAATLGLYGVFMGFLAILIHMASLRSFGVPYLSPVAPLELSSLKDVFIRAPWWDMLTRPGFTGSLDSRRMKADLRPVAPPDRPKKKRKQR
ncbi:spore germination protein [Propionispora vibrioides]|uniref:Spore germination protein KA n=1 Tax=Propionispora vibrioides TaxID=112903 RepID=A0A1H8TTA5_9FIRM|nr:spore germination protein [Propionispora vibrioides]SEO93668.1 spore germination protein KA [Propionispora vibrioides]